jgi:two-component system sensor histidine kinase KdpD
LGLAICRAAINAHGGHIAAMQRPGGGARFVFTLPTTEAPA